MKRDLKSLLPTLSLDEKNVYFHNLYQLRCGRHAIIADLETVERDKFVCSVVSSPQFGKDSVFRLMQKIKNYDGFKKPIMKSPAGAVIQDDAAFNLECNRFWSNIYFNRMWDNMNPVPPSNANFCISYDFFQETVF